MSETSSRPAQTRSLFEGESGQAVVFAAALAIGALLLLEALGIIRISFALVLALSLNAARLLAQAAPQNSPPPPHHQMGDHATAMHHHMQMQEQVTKMRSTLDQMKANVGTISDSASREHAQLDLELWESMVQHMEDMVKMMSMGGTGMKEGADHSRMEMKETPQTPK